MFKEVISKNQKVAIKRKQSHVTAKLFPNPIPELKTQNTHTQARGSFLKIVHFGPRVDNNYTSSEILKLPDRI